MFITELSNQFKRDITYQFEGFKKEGGKLPSFSVAIKPLSENTKEIPEIEKQVGDYIFYKATDKGFWFSFCGSYCFLSGDMKKADVFLSDNLQSDGQYETSNLLMQAYMYRLVNTGNFMIHSAAINFENNAILFCGLSGAGKSTQAKLWGLDLNVKLLNFDKPCVINDSGKLYAHGSPWSGKEELYLNKYAPLKAVVFVKQAKENRVVRLSPAQAFANIYLHNYVYPLTEEIERKYTDIINTTANKIPVYELYCDISEDAVRVLFEELFPGLDYSKEKQTRTSF